MEFDFFQSLANTLSSLQLMLLILTAIIHLIFASAVAHDAGNLAKANQDVCLVSGMSWAFATLLGGVIVAAVYWFIHHSTLTRIQ